MKKIILFLWTVIVTQTVFSQNVTVTIDAPLPVCNSGDCTTLQANYISTQPTSTYTVASIPYNPLFITTGGTLITSTNADDIWSDVAFTLPFNFCFYGQTYSSVLIGSNGVVHFPNGSQSAAGFCPWSFSASIPNASFPIRNAIYGVYQDTDIRTPPVTNGAIQNVNYYIAGTAPNRVFVANFNQLPQFSCGAGVGLQTTQVILYETTNVIDVLVKNRTSCTSWNGGRGVIGVQNSAGTQAVVPTGRNTGTWSATNEAWRFTPAQAGPTNTTLTWLANGSPIPGSTNVNPLTVCPTVATTYTAQVDYLQCDGFNKTVSDNVTVGPEPPLPTLNPQNIVQCTSGPGPYTFNINQNAYMLNGAPASDYIFYYYIDNAGVPGAQIPNGTLAAYTPASSTYPQTIWVLIEDQNTTGCTNLRSFTLNVVGAPSGTFSYASPFCDSETTPQAPTLTGLTSGGTYTASPAGLIINSVTGAITPNGSTPNTYTVNYNIPASGSCPAYAAPPVSVTISPSPVAPTVNTIPATCSSDGISTITNYNITYTYTFTPAGPTVGVGGVISGMTAGTAYTVIANNGSCDSPVSAPFTNPVMLVTPAVPTIISTAATCSASGSSTVSNYNASETYVFTPAGPSVGAGGAISGMIIGTPYTVTAGNGSCTSAASAPFSNAPTATVPAVPTIATTPATCLADGSSTITNYNATQGYTFTPSGPSAGAGGVITGMVAGTNYTVTAANGSCTSAASASFNNPVMLNTPLVPTITSVAPTCTADGTSTISNYNATYTYNFLPVGPTVGATGLISGMTNGVPYTVNASLGTCFSANTAPFSNAPMSVAPVAPTVNTTAATCTADGISTITNYNATYTYTFTPAGPTAGAGGVISGMTVGTAYTVIANNGCDSPASASFTNAVMLVTPVVPTITSVAPTCTTDGTSTISNYNATYTYTFTPVGPAVGATGLISGMTNSVPYTVNASLGTCFSANTVPFSNAPMAVAPVAPTVNTTPATCTADGISTITNYNATYTYTFTPAGPTAGAGGAISGMVVGTAYTVIANNGCNSPASASFTNAAMLVTPVVPTITSVGPTCTANGSSTISNYNATYTYNFLPLGPTVGAGGLINGMVVGTSYTVNASLGTCFSANTAPFSNAPMSVAPVAPTVNTTPATCASNGTSTITNYNATYTYAFTPAGPTVGAAGAISGMVVGTAYTVIANNGCDSPASASFTNAVMLVTPVVPTITSVGPTCTANGTSTISNYNATYTYNFLPLGPTVGAGGLINGMVVGTSYTVNASLGTCFSANTTPFSNAAMLPAPTLVITNPAAVCSPSTVDITAAAVTAGSTTGGTYSYWSNPGGTTSLPNPASIAVSGTYYIMLTVSGCSDIEPVVVTINAKPNPVLNPGTICLDSSGTPISTYLINSNLNNVDYTFVWTDDSGATVGTQSTYEATAPGTYTVVATSVTTPPCNSDPVSVSVGTSSPPSDISFQTSNYFADNLTITVIATPASSNYEYQLENGPFQDSNVFSGLQSGTYKVTVRDKRQCGAIFEYVTLVDFPRYFTPNNDGYHDTWNIPFLSSQATSKIEIFDRFGKLIKVIQPSGMGWDGTYANQQLPSTDYWFVVYYEEDGVAKIHRAHFAMKR